MPTWTTDPPAVRGHYWFRPLFKGRPAKWCGVWLVRPPMGGEYQPPTNDSPAALEAYMPGNDQGVPVTEMRGEWWGPLVPPGDGGAVPQKCEDCNGTGELHKCRRCGTLYRHINKYSDCGNARCEGEPYTVVPCPACRPGGAVVSDSDRGPATADGRAWKGV